MPDKDPLGMNAPDVKQQPTNDPLGMNASVDTEKKKNTPSVSSGGGALPLQEYKPSGPTFPEGYAETFAHVNPDNVKVLLGAQVNVLDGLPNISDNVQKMRAMGETLKNLTPPNQRIPDTKHWNEHDPTPPVYAPTESKKKGVGNKEVSVPKYLEDIKDYDETPVEGPTLGYKTDALSLEDQQRLKAGDKLPEVQKLAADAEYKTLKDINEGTGVQQSDALTAKLAPPEDTVIKTIVDNTPFLGLLIQATMSKQAMDLANVIPVAGPLSTDLAKGVVLGIADVMDDLDGANKIFNDAVNTMTGKTVFNPDDKTLFKRYSDYIKSSDEIKQTHPVFHSEQIGETAKSLGQMAPMFLAMEGMEGMKVAGVLLPKLPIYLGGSTGLAAYSSARANDMNIGQALEQATKVAAPATFEGFAFDGLGYTSKQVSKYLMDETGHPLIASGVGTGLNAVGFVGAGQTSATLQGQEYTPEQRHKDFLMGFSLGGFDMAKSAAGELSQALYKRAWQNWASADPEYLSKMSEQQMIKDPPKARQAAIDIREEAQNEPDKKVRKQKIMAANAIDGMLDWQSVNKIVADNVTAVKELINNDPTLEGKDDVKKKLLKRVDKAAVATDPLHREAETLAQEIHDRRGMIEQNNSNSEYSDEVKRAKNTPIEAEIKDFEQQIQDLYDPKKQQEKKAKQVKEEPKPVEPKKEVVESTEENKPIPDKSNTKPFVHDDKVIYNGKEGKITGRLLKQ